MTSRGEDLRARLMVTFRQEAEEHVGVITSHLIALERGLPAPEAASAVEAVFRATHTLKGAARSVSLEAVESLCQGLESVLSGVKRERRALTPELVGLMQEAVTGVERLLAGPSPALSPPDPGRPGPVTPAAQAAAPATLRIAIERLDDLQSRAEDLLAVKLSAHERVREAQALVETPSSGAARGLLARLSHDRQAIAAALDALEDELRPLRLTPASTVLELLAPMAAGMARSQGKEIDFEVAGAELELDRKLLEVLKDPLLHLVRNALDHGIESPESRARAGKARRGRIRVALSPLEGRRLEVRVEDDGAGIDLAGLRSAAVRARVLGPEAALALPDVAALDLVFASGVSTSPVITDLSGHGLGMAIVRDRVEQLGGRVSLEAVPGKGTTVRIVVPASIASFRGLLVRAGGQAFLLPIDAVERAFRVAPGEARALGAGEAVRSDGRAYPAAGLGAILGRGRGKAEGDSPRTCLLLAAGEERGGLFVDEVLGEREVLVKELRPPLVRVRHVAGAALLGSGELALILRPADLVRALGEAPRAEEPARAGAEASRPAILVVDDSITTRTMERNLLEAAGYEVRVAADGMEGWTALKSERFDLVVSDVDMPRLDGFGLTARIRADPHLGSLPVVLVTALESREDKERGIDVGANAYVIKSGFDQSKLLEIIERLL